MRDISRRHLFLRIFKILSTQKCKKKKLKRILNWPCTGAGMRGHRPPRVSLQKLYQERESVCVCPWERVGVWVCQRDIFSEWERHRTEGGKNSLRSNLETCVCFLCFGRPRRSRDNPLVLPPLRGNESSRVVPGEMPQEETRAASSRTRPPSMRLYLSEGIPSLSWEY